MGIRRRKINSEIVKDIRAYWTDEKKAAVLKRIRKGIFIEVGPYEKLEESKIQEWAHRMVPTPELTGHADRLDVKASLRKYMRQQTIAHLGLQKYFPELFEEIKKKKDKVEYEDK